ncbi:MAG TPA: NTP transferase domain-containing protein [Nocardioidaceae bacterium]|nr:NTP transferase domain-containing protein [Nocardioidaceae bacterium]
MPDDRPYAGIVLAGGGSARLGRDKTRVEVGGRSALDRVLAAFGDAAQIVVVGNPRPVDRPDVVWTHEEPPGGGPAAGVAAAAAVLSQPWAVVLAGDLPLIDAAAVHRLLAGARDPHDGAVLVDAGGRRQHLSVAVRTEALRQRTVGRDWHGAPMWSLLDGLSLAEVAAHAHETLDLDEPRDIEAARRLAPDSKGPA